MKKFIKILLRVLLFVITPIVVMIVVLDWNPFLSGGIIFVLLIAFTPLKNPKPTPKQEKSPNPIIKMLEDGNPRYKD